MAKTNTREKIVRKVGDSVGIILNKEERNLYGLNVGDAVLISISKSKKVVQE